MGAIKGGKIEVTKYGMALHFGVCAKADALLRVIVKEKVAWEGVVTTQSSFPIRKKELFGGVEKEGGVEGVVYWLPGNDDQVIDDLLAQKMGRSGGTDCPGYRGIASAFFVGPKGTPYAGLDWAKKVGGKKGFYWSCNIPYLPGVWLTVRRAPVGLQPEIAMVPRLGVDFFPYAAADAGGSSIASLQFSPDGLTFVISTGSGYQVWDAVAHEMIASYTSTGGDFAVGVGGVYALDAFSGQNLIFVTFGGAESIVVPWANFPVIMGSVWYVAGTVFLAAAVGGEGYKVVGDTIVALGSSVDSYFVGPGSTAWGVGQDGSDIALLDVEAGTYFTVPSPTTGAAYAMTNPLGQILVLQGDYFVLVDPATETVLDTQSGIDIDRPELAFRNVMSGASSIWGETTEYSTTTLLALRTVNLDAWAAAGSISAGVYSPVDHALISTPLFTDEIQFRLLDRGNYDANPAHIIYEALTDEDWGMGSPSAAIDVASFEAAAATLYSESLGLSLFWTKQSTIQDFIQEIQDHIQSVLFVDPATGLLTLKLVRGDYDPDTLETIDPSNARLTSFSRKIWGDIANEITVSWTNPETEQDETITVQDLASIAAQGTVVSDSRNYYGVRTSMLAQRLGQRDLRSAGAPLAGFEAEVSRALWEARPASVYKCDWPEHGLSGIVVRVIDVDYGKPGDSTIHLSLLEDVYGLDVGQYITPPDSLAVDTSSQPAPLDESRVITLPTYMAAHSRVDVSGAVYPQVIAGVLGTSDDEDTLSYELWGEVTDALGETEWAKLAENNVLSFGELDGALDAEAVSSGVVFTNLIGGVDAARGVFVLIGEEGEEGDELALITAAGTTLTLSRGMLDTIPRSWPTGTPVWLLDNDTFFDDPTTRSAGEIVRYKLRTRTSLGLLNDASAPVIAYTLGERPWLPNRPAGVAIDGVLFNTAATPVDMIGETEVPVSWSNRNRRLEDGTVFAWTDGDATPETGQTTTIYIYAEDGTTLLDTIPGLTGTSYAIPAASFGGEAIALVKVGSTRTDGDGEFDSLQAHGIWVQLNPISAGVLAASGAGALTTTGASGMAGVLSASGTAATALVGEQAVLTSPIRSQSITAAGSGDPRTLSLPTGAQAGDRLIVFAGGAFNISAGPSGFTQLNLSNGGFWSGGCWHKVLSSGDISTGTVTVDYAGSSGNVIWLVCMIGAPSVVTSEFTRTAGSASANHTDSVTTASAAPAAGDFVLYFGSERVSSANVTTLNRGTAETIDANSLANSGGRGFSETLGSGGTVSATWTYSLGSNGDYQGMVVLDI